jgi:hypothetical protein
LDYIISELSLNKDCSFESSTAKQCKENAVIMAFLNGIQSSEIRIRLLEAEKDKALSWEEQIKTAKSMDLAKRDSVAFIHPVDSTPITASADSAAINEPYLNHTHGTYALAAMDHQRFSRTKGNSKCYYCGYSVHPRFKCPAKDQACSKCNKIGHFSKVCRYKAPQQASAILATSVQAVSSKDTTQPYDVPPSLSKCALTIQINQNRPVKALVDSGSTDSYISDSYACELKLKIHPFKSEVSMAVQTQKSIINGYCTVDIKCQGTTYSQKLCVMKQLCSKVLLGHDFMRRHDEVILQFGGTNPPLHVGTLAVLTMANFEPPSVFENLAPDCHPIATKSRKFSADDEKFISREIKKMLTEGVKPALHPGVHKCIL